MSGSQFDFCFSAALPVMENVNAGPFFPSCFFYFYFYFYFLISFVNADPTRHSGRSLYPQFPIRIPKFVGPTSYRPQEGKPQSPYYGYARGFSQG